MQDFCMQTDSHMDFSDNWDTEMVDMFHLTQNDYSVLSTYVTDIGENNKDPTNVPHLCLVQFTSSIRNWGTKECNFLTKPKLTNAMWGAGLSFHRCHAELNVPVDPYLDNVFDGEEGSRGIRFFTHGYDVYTPHRVLVTHDYVSLSVFILVLLLLFISTICSLILYADWSCLFFPFLVLRFSSGNYFVITAQSSK